jgi:membrane carboxypeptidase/penicillin-binding protein PbpC
MRKVSPEIIGYVFLSATIVMVLGACVKPVDVGPFLSDPKVEEIIRKGKTGGDVDIEYEHPKDIAPELQADGVGVTTTKDEAGNTVTVLLSNLGTVTITVTNAEQYDNIEWHYNGSSVKNGDTLAMSSMTVVFNAVGNYPVTVIGEKGGVYYSTLFYIKVES